MYHAQPAYNVQVDQSKGLYMYISFERTMIYHPVLDGMPKYTQELLRTMYSLPTM